MLEDGPKGKINDWFIIATNKRRNARGLWYGQKSQRKWAVEQAINVKFTTICSQRRDEWRK
jgi:hypothetical protein